MICVYKKDLRTVVPEVSDTCGFGCSLEETLLIALLDRDYEENGRKRPSFLTQTLLFSQELNPLSQRRDFCFIFF